jgi:hypothetical protein
MTLNPATSNEGGKGRTERILKPLRQLRDLVVYLGTNASPWVIVTAFLALNVYWPVLLGVLDEQFREATNGLPLLDLQNSFAPGSIVTPARVLEQLPAYTDTSVLLYWVFFVLDSIFPLLVFGTYSLLWVCLWRNSPDRVSRWWMGSYVALIPLGIQLFDWGENLFYVLAIHNYPEPGTVTAIYAGLVFKWLKVACVLPTTLLTPVFLAYFLYQRVRGGGKRRAASRGANPGAAT